MLHIILHHQYHHNIIVIILFLYPFFDNYYHETMNKLEHKSNMLENGGCETALSKNNSSLFAKLLNKIKKLISSKNIEQKEQD